MIRFETFSGTTYTLNLETGELVRKGVRPLEHWLSGEDMGEPAGEVVTWTEPPTVGREFYYQHPTLHGCSSTQVISIEELS